MENFFLCPFALGDAKSESILFEAREDAFQNKDVGDDFIRTDGVVINVGPDEMPK